MSGFSRVQERIDLRDADAATVTRLAAELSVPEAVARILVVRHLDSYETCKAFFRPTVEQFNDPFLFEGMEPAVTRIGKAIDAGEKIVVYGDYDVDGITSTVLMVRGQLFPNANSILKFVELRL